MTLVKAISKIIFVAISAIVVFLSLLLAHNAILYFTHGGEYGILPEKWVARQDLLWNIAFYVHLPSGIVCLLSPLVLFLQRVQYTGIRIHQWVGRMYVWVTLVLVCPTGMYLALYAKGGLVTQVGFAIQGVLLFLFTYCGYECIRKGNREEHFQYMIRSYAVASVVLTFRVLHILFFLTHVPYHVNYAISQWLGLAGNVLVAECVVYYVSIKSNHLTIKSKSL